MAYVLPRAAIVLMLWGVTCGLIVTVLPDADPAVFTFAGISWALAGIVCFGYIRKLRNEENSLRVRDIARFQQPAE
jgi:hypothetical protein